MRTSTILIARMGPLALACGPVSPNDTDAPASTASSGTHDVTSDVSSTADPTSTGTSGTTGTTTGDPIDPSAGIDTSGGTDTSTSGTDPSGGADTGENTGENTDTGEPIDPGCAPVESLWGPDHGQGYTWAPWGSVAEPCVLTSIAPAALEFVFDCPKWQQEKGTDFFSFTIQRGPAPDPLPAIGATFDVFAVHHDLTLENFGGTLIVRRDGALVYAALRDLQLVHPEAPGPEIYAPLELSRIDDCALIPGFVDDTSGFPAGDGFVCEQVARARLRAALPGGEPIDLFEGSDGLVSGAGHSYAVDVERVWRAVDCQPDFPQGEMEVMTFAIAAQPG